METATGAAALAWRYSTVNEPNAGHTKWAQLLRYIIVGITSNLIGYCLYLALTALILPPKTTMTLLYTTGAVLGFIGNRRFTFRHQGKLPRAAFAYTVTHMLGWTMNYMLLYVLSDQLGYPHQLVQAFAIIVIAIFLFIALRYFVFPTTLTKTGLSP